MLEFINQVFMEVIYYLKNFDIWDRSKIFKTNIVFNKNRTSRFAFYQILMSAQDTDKIIA